MRSAGIEVDGDREMHGELNAWLHGIASRCRKHARGPFAFSPPSLDGVILLFGMLNPLVLFLDS